MPFKYCPWWSTQNCSLWRKFTLVLWIILTGIDSMSNVTSAFRDTNFLDNALTTLALLMYFWYQIVPQRKSRTDSNPENEGAIQHPLSKKRDVLGKAVTNEIGQVCYWGAQRPCATICNCLRGVEREREEQSERPCQRSRPWHHRHASIWAGWLQVATCATIDSLLSSHFTK